MQPPSSGPPYVIRPTSGAFIQARVFHLHTRADAEAYGAEFGRILRAMPRTARPVLCADHRPVAIYPPPVADKLAELFLDMNSRLERIAIVARKTNATLLLQLERLVREAALAKRRVFYDIPGAVAHLTPSLEASEVAEARRFLEEYAP